MENPIGNEKHSSDSDIITETPPRLCKKKIKKISKARTRRKSSHHYEDYLENQKCVPDENCSIEKTRVGSVDLNKPYVYRTIDEILEFSQNYLPKNNNMHLVGVHKFSPQFGNYLTNRVVDGTESSFIQLDFKFVANVPDENTYVSVYGSLESDARCHRNMIFVIRFYREEAAGMINRYKESLKFLRNYIPTQCLTAISSKR